MGEIALFPETKLIIGVISSSLTVMEELEGKLERLYGPIDSRIGPWPFAFTEYYTKEMGPEIFRFFFSFETLIDPSGLSVIKRKTNEIEEKYTAGGSRRINIDPGIMTVDNFILATTKRRGHRIPLEDGIYGEITLIYMNRDFQPLPWTYADFRSREYRDHLREVRKKYLVQLKRQSG
jgi:hypothetical protein